MGFFCVSQRFVHVVINTLITGLGLSSQASLDLCRRIGELTSRFHRFVYFFYRVHHRGVVPVAEFLSDLRKPAVLVSSTSQRAMMFSVLTL